MKDMPLYLIVALTAVVPIAAYCLMPLDDATVSRLEMRHASAHEVRHAAMEEVRQWTHEETVRHMQSTRAMADVHLIEFIRGHSSFISDEDLKYGSEHLRKLAEEKL